MPDLLIKEKELAQLQSIVDEFPTKYGLQIMGFCQGVAKLRQKEEAEASLVAAAKEQAVKGILSPFDQQKKDGIYHPEPLNKRTTGNDSATPDQYKSFEGDILTPKSKKQQDEIQQARDVAYGYKNNDIAPIPPHLPTGRLKHDGTEDKRVSPDPIVGQGPNGPETKSERAARVKRYSDHIGLGDGPQGDGCSPCEEKGVHRY